ncbi:MAG: deoxyribonuclease IV [Thermodesulfovibrionales bacterium]|nr:deoxyribonuclease IV [Thermodesulfovibrionales bacterium]
MYEKSRVGVHVSIAGGFHLSIKRAIKLGCNTIQIFTHSPRQWNVVEIKKEEISEFKYLRQLHDINPLFIHASYLINLCSLNEKVYHKSIDLLLKELEIATILDADYVVLHLGGASGMNKEKAIEKVLSALKTLSSKINTKRKVLIENTSGKKGDISTTFKDLSNILYYDTSGILGGICIDTSHAFAAGYDIGEKTTLNALINEIENFIGMEKVKLIHLNDSKNKFNSKVDRHEHIGKGYIGLKGFKIFLENPAFKKIPIILETPKKSDLDDLKNLKVVKKLLNSDKPIELIEKISKYF